MKSFNKIFFLLFMFLLFASCERDAVQSPSAVDYPILFSLEETTPTRVAYGEQSDGGISAKFDVGDEFGLYFFYNNFYYYYNDYGCFAESVQYANQGLAVYEGSTSGELYAVSNPIMSWTFSTVYGTAPHTLDCVAYYPFRTGYNPNYVNMLHNESGAAWLEYYYVSRESVTTDDVTSEQVTINSNVDFMVAGERYDYSNDAAPTSTFRSEMLALSSIPLAFTRQMASLNLQVTKPDGYSNVIKVLDLTFYIYANEKFVKYIATNTIEWSDKGTDLLSFTVELNDEDQLDDEDQDEPILAETGWDSTPNEGESNDVKNLFADKNMLFFPPDTEIWKIVFTIDDGGTEKSYTWHPHVDTIVANTHYTLSLELDPDRAN